MKFLCISSIENNDNNVVVDDNHPNEKKRKESKTRLWFESIRNFFTADKTSRVEISEPTPLPKDDVSKITGIVEVGPQIHENPIDKIDNKKSSFKETENVSNKVNAETNTEIEQFTISNKDNDLKSEINDVFNQGWFWGDITRRDAESLLRGQEEGTFLVRLSSDRRFLYSLSFRSNGKTLHTRIECSNGLFYFYSNDSNTKQEMDGSSSLVDLITEAMNQNNAENIFFYSRGLKSGASLHTITLVKPLSRFQYILNYNYSNKGHKSLQYLCKFIIHHSTVAQAKLELHRSSLPNELNTFLNDILLFPGAKQKCK